MRLAAALFLSGLILGIIAVGFIGGVGWGLLAAAAVLVFLGISAYVELGKVRP